MYAPSTIRPAPVIDGDAILRKLSGITDALARGEGLFQGMRIRTMPTVAGEESSAHEPRGMPALHTGRGAIVVVIAIEPTPDSVPDAREIGRRFGLTPRQAQVALLLAERRSDKEIARELAISRHTARRHVEAVLLRLGIHDRKEVRERLSEAVRAPWEPETRGADPVRALPRRSRRVGGRTAESATAAR